jgi:hypothetical protein
VVCSMYIDHYETIVEFPMVTIGSYYMYSHLLCEGYSSVLLF